MICTKLAFVQFRNIEQAIIEPSRDVNVFYGQNAQGKTNALEGIYLMAQGRSFRAAKEKDMIRFGQQMAGIRLTFDDKNGSGQTIEMRLYENGRRQCFYNGVPQKRLSETIGHFRSVIFCPEHLAIVKSGPGIRRDFVDMALSQLDVVYLRNLQEYVKILKQRNAMLKACRNCDEAFRDSIDVWSRQLASRGALLAEKRAVYLSKTQEAVDLVFSDMTEHKETVELRYTAGRSEQEYLQLLRGNLEREVKNQSTLYGIHRDDYEILLNGREARSFASQGQQRSIAVAMKVAEGEISKKATGEYPVFLLDDVFSELDSKRRAYIMSGMTDRQVFITGCDPILTDKKIFTVSDGTFSKN